MYLLCCSVCGKKARQNNHGGGQVKTWQIYKIALENPKAKFKRLNQGDICYMDKEKGQLQIFDKPKSYPIAMVDEDWELMSEPVDFMTAVNSDRQIRCNEDYEFSSVSYYLNARTLSKEILNGEWYIK